MKTKPNAQNEQHLDTIYRTKAVLVDKIQPTVYKIPNSKFNLATFCGSFCKLSSRKKRSKLKASGTHIKGINIQNEKWSPINTNIMNGTNNKNAKKKYDPVFPRSMAMVTIPAFRSNSMSLVLLACRIDSVFRANGSAYRIGIIDNWPDWLRYENMTVSGPNVKNISKSPKAIYFSPRPPVYRKLEDSPPKYMRARCSIFAGEMIVKMKHPRHPTM